VAVEKKEGDDDDDASDGANAAVCLEDNDPATERVTDGTSRDAPKRKAFMLMLMICRVITTIC